MKLRKGAKIESYVPTAPMSDIAFLLIVFFMITSTFPVDRSSLTLPGTELRFQVEDKNAAWIVAYVDRATQQVYLRVTDGKKMSAPLEEGNPFPMDRLEGWIYTISEISPNKLFLLKIDRSVPYLYADKILTAIKNTNAVRNIVFLSDAEKGLR